MLIKIYPPPTKSIKGIAGVHGRAAMSLMKHHSTYYELLGGKQMKTTKQVAEELHDELVRELVAKELKLDTAHLWEPIKKQDKICAEIRHIEESISLLEKRYNL